MKNLIYLMLFVSTPCYADKLTIPTDQEQKQALVDVIKYEKSLDSTDLNDIANELELAATKTSKTSQKYVALMQSLDLRVSSMNKSTDKNEIDVTDIFNTIDTIDTLFQIDKTRLRASTLKKLKTSAQRNQELAINLTNIGLDAIKSALDNDEIMSGVELSDVVSSLSKIGKDQTQRTLAENNSKLFKNLSRDWDKIVKAKEILSNQDNTNEHESANLIYGRYLCFQKSDWLNGLACLSSCDNEELSDLAIDDLSTDELAIGKDCLKLAQRWSKITGASARSIYWLKLALRNSATEVEAQKIEELLLIKSELIDITSTVYAFNNNNVEQRKLLTFSKTSEPNLLVTGYKLPETFSITFNTTRVVNDTFGTGGGICFIVSGNKNLRITLDAIEGGERNSQLNLDGAIVRYNSNGVILNNTNDITLSFNGKYCVVYVNKIEILRTEFSGQIADLKLGAQVAAFSINRVLVNKY